MKKLIYITTLITLVSFNTRSQGIHFSQYYEAPLLLNPGNSGTIKTDIRANVLYRNQWASVGNSYKTMYASIDAPILKNDYDKKTTGIGLSFFSDKAGKSNYGRTEVSLSASQSVHINGSSEISAGLVFTFGQVSANFDGLKWDNQYDGTKYVESLPTGEGNINTSSSYFDVGAGVVWKYYGERNNESNAGISIMNATQTWKATLANSSSSDKRNFRIILHGKTEIPISQDYNNFIIPSFFISQQAGSRELTLGALYKTEVGLNSNYTGYFTSSYLYGGMIYRFQDAVVAIIKYEWQKRIQLGVSYDINASKLKTASNYQGALEISITWKGEF